MFEVVAAKHSLVRWRQLAKILNNVISERRWWTPSYHNGRMVLLVSVHGEYVSRIGAQMLRRLDVDWESHGFDDDATSGMAEIVMRVWLSFLQYPANPPRSDDDLRQFIRRWVCPPVLAPVALEASQTESR